MKIVTSLNDLFDERAKLTEPVGLVPTMGYLHEGHLSLVREAKKECESVVVTIYVNPTQFGPNEDLESYPRDLERDTNLLRSEGVDLLWIPTSEIMYPPGYQTWIEVTELTGFLEGQQRPGHFKGVTTIVTKLFNAIHPQKAFFGQKDAQQAIVIQRMIKDLNYNLEIKICPIIREPDGLALSSRNVYLNPAERQAATILNKSLNMAKQAYKNGERSSQKIIGLIENIINKEPLAKIQYVSCANLQTLEEVEGDITKPVLISMAVFFQKTRLIDNIVLGG
jgi:pantoate--beta-alanine ligase